MFLLDDFANRFLQTPFETEKTSGRNGAIGTVMRFIPGGGGGTAIYGLYGDVPLGRVWFSSSLL